MRLITEKSYPPSPPSDGPPINCMPRAVEAVLRSQSNAAMVRTPVLPEAVLLGALRPFETVVIECRRPIAALRDGSMNQR
jgi:hypothetical protein